MRIFYTAFVICPANTLGQSECPVIHVKGEKNIFNIYEIGFEDHLLAFYSFIGEVAPSSPSGASTKSFDFSSADKSMRKVLEDLQLLLKNVVW